ncbi:MAG: FAD-binding oxidoreductase [Acetobacteraceae bacterium]|nr:FAD-binding oxidoreductase [Acetobacteraceae bacterium]
MIDHADVVVIGSGGLGAATAYNLAKRGGVRVALLDKHDIGSQTSPRAAGLVSNLRKTRLLIDLVRKACGNIETFSSEVGQPLDWVHSGSIKVARRPQDAEVLAADFERGRAAGLDVEPVSAEEAHRLNPFLQPTGITAALRIGDDRYFNPAQLAIGFARGAEAKGAVVLPKTEVTAVEIFGGKVTGVQTSRGRITTPVVVDAAGAWTRQVAEASGLHIPLAPARHQLIVTEPLEGVRADLPIVRIMDAAVYMRPCDGGLLWGGYEDQPHFFDMASLGQSFDIKDTPLDINVLYASAAEVEAQLPVLRTAKVREFRGGIPTLTADGQYILGPVPAAEGFFFASGCNVAGLSISPALGEMLAEWIVDGKPSLDLSPLSPARFQGRQSSEEQLRRDSAWQYRHFYGAA